MATTRTSGLVVAATQAPCQRRSGEPGGHDDEVTRDRFDLMARHCADMGIPIDWEDLGPNRRGKCQTVAGRIVLNPRMTLVQAACTLAHEVGHWEFGDLRSSASNERRAWEFGASLLVTRFEYEMAERIVGTHPGALAAELGVTTKLVEAWRRWWLRRGQFESPTDWTEESLASP